MGYSLPLWQPLTMTVVLWVLAVPSLALGGLAYGRLPDWFDGDDLAPTLTTSVLGTGLALTGGLVTYAAWRYTTALARNDIPITALDGDWGRAMPLAVSIVIAALR